MTSRRNVLTRAVGGLAFLGFPAIVRASGPSITLDLCFDCSNSMFSHVVQFDNWKFVPHATIQRDGHIKALQTDAISTALIENRVLVRLIGWHEVAWELAPPIRIEDQSDIASLCSSIMNTAPMVRSEGARSTQHHAAVAFALHHPHGSERHIIDISTDENPPTSSYDTCLTLKAYAEQHGVQINALAVGLDAKGSAELHTYVCTRTGVVVPTGDWRGYFEGISMKLALELGVS